MTFCGKLTELVLIAACVICGHVAQTPCTTDGWFGPNCQYQCHCENSSRCDKVNGSCSSDCDLEWFGPACQYSRTTFTASGLGWLTDNSDTTCNTGSSTSVTVNLNTAIPLTWVRVVLNDAGYLNQTELRYKLTSSSFFQSCTDPRTAKVDDVTLDIYCPTDTTGSQITLSGQGVLKLCVLYISGGRNVALKQPAQQSSRYIPPDDPDSFLAETAVDGHIGGNTKESARSTCTHTGVEDSPDWWAVNLTQAVDVNSFLIYNRVDCCQFRLVGFTLMAQPESGSSVTQYIYDDVYSQPQSSYSVLPSSKINFPVSRVKIDVKPNPSATNADYAILTLCEVLIFGENRCPPNTFGLSCERQCNCASGGRTCFVHSGGCPDGCATNYDGKDCYDCVIDKYGANCDRACSAHCGGDNSCDRSTGVCNHGCDPGYTGDQCLLACPKGHYGKNCEKHCSDFCAGPDHACNNVDGFCDQGCEPGYFPPLCVQKCPGGRYGLLCNQTCSVYCAGPMKECDHETGNCLQGCEVGFEPPTCHYECPAGAYGQDCKKICSVHCAGYDIDCNKTDGSCDMGCEPGYQGRFCSEVCPRGKYGPGCVQNCSAQCAGQERPCNRVDGVCHFGCVEDDLSPICHGPGVSAWQQSDEAGESDSTIWAISATVVAAVAVVVIGFLAWRLFKRTPTIANNCIVEEGPQRKECDQSPRQREISNENSSNKRYDLAQVGPEDVNLYNEGLDHYENPLDLMRGTEDYETPQPVVITDSNQDYVEADNIPSVGRTAESSIYVNAL